MADESKQQQPPAFFKCDGCGKPERFNVLCPDCEDICCTECGCVICLCEKDSHSNNSR